ncbi:MAG: hypothetical protein H0T65_02115, partial [Deltaproteobacteria bacterium]|nr:hypothetical protein [Deltaproteobacteria bacterium]
GPKPSPPTIEVPITVGSSVHVPKPKPGDDNSSALRRMLPTSKTRWYVLALILVAAAAGAFFYVTKTPADTRVVTPAPADAAVALVDATFDPTDAILANANELAAAGKVDAAIDVLTDARRVYPNRAVLPLTAGKLYFSKLWWNDGLANFREAIKLDPALKNDPAVLDAAVRAFTTTPGYDGRLAQFVVELGAPVSPLLEEVAKSHANPGIRARAKSIRQRIR